MNLLTKFHEDRTVNVASRVKNAPPLGSHVFQANIVIFELIKDIIEKCPATGGHVFKATKTIFELIQDIIGTNLQTKFHDDGKINVTSRVLTSFELNPTINVASRVFTRQMLTAHNARRTKGDHKSSP
ncbi:hypothetical protein DPMN_100339 [Dreissena polymorpha]|uniref:Uncharacterized protein n=1 Tax=Dreissena polymorpha TaxID=45954 RepID=A0A9D4LJ24_DREPO|nr:hypothetical protein DPMN_100339 [Dreissena polymorpha]